MKVFIKFVAILYLIVVPAHAKSPNRYQSVAASSTLIFTSHANRFEVQGTFDKWQAFVTLNSQGQPTKVQLNIDARTISTGWGPRDGHLRSEDFFSVEKFPTINFESRKIVALKDGQFMVVGILKILGHEQPISTKVSVTNLNKDGKRLVKAAGQLRASNKAWGLGYQSKLFFIPPIKDETLIHFDILLAP